MFVKFWIAFCSFAHRNIKLDDMKKLMILVMVLFSANVFAQGTKNFIDQNYIEVTGKAEKKITPNEIYIRIVIDETDNKGKVSVEQQERDMLKALKALNIDVEKNLKVLDQGSNFKDYILKKNVILTSKEYLLLVSTGQMAGNVFIRLENIGISNISIDHVDHSDIEQFKREVKIEAVKAAKEKASDLASAIGQEVGRALYICGNENHYPRYGMSNMKLMANVTMDMASGIEEAADLEFEKITLEYSVQVYFELK